MKILILCPGTIPNNTEEIKCFTDVLCYYLPKSLTKLTDTEVTIQTIPPVDGDELKKTFSEIDVDGCHAIITLGLRFYSKISPDTVEVLRSRFSGLLCQVHDGSRLDYDPVDITFTFKDDDRRMSDNNKRFERHKKFNEYMGWATDFNINTPGQSSTDLRILVDHTNYGDNPVDETVTVLEEIKKFIDSELWKTKFESVSVRRFDSGRVVDVDFDNLHITKYDRTTIPFQEITKEHCAAHIFCVTHPESVGLVVLETAAAGALPLVPKGFVPDDRLATIRHVEWKDSIDWEKVLASLDIPMSRKVALKNTWDAAAGRIYDILTARINQKASSND